jgi:hypothetical protein
MTKTRIHGGSMSKYCWTWWYGGGVDVKEGQYDQCWAWNYGVGIDVKKINMVLSLRKNMYL